MALAIKWPKIPAIKVEPGMRCEAIPIPSTAHRALGADPDRPAGPLWGRVLPGSSPTPMPKAGVKKHGYRRNTVSRRPRSRDSVALHFSAAPGEFAGQACFTMFDFPRAGRTSGVNLTQRPFRRAGPRAAEAGCAATQSRTGCTGPELGSAAGGRRRRCVPRTGP